MVGDAWSIRYVGKPGVRPPHVEDVLVLEHRHVGRVSDLKRIVLDRTRPWEGPTTVLFDSTTRQTDAGTAFIPAQGRLPRCSTGYWLPDVDVVRRMVHDRARFVCREEKTMTWFAWVGVQEP